MYGITAELQRRKWFNFKSLPGGQAFKMRMVKLFQYAAAGCFSACNFNENAFPSQADTKPKHAVKVLPLVTTRKEASVEIRNLHNSVCSYSWTAGVGFGLIFGHISGNFIANKVNDCNGIYCSIICKYYYHLPWNIHTIFDTKLILASSMEVNIKPLKFTAHENHSHKIKNNSKHELCVKS